MLSRILLIVAICLVLTLLPYALLPLRADTFSPHEIAFLTIQVSGDEVHLLAWNTVPGTLKPERSPSPRSGITYEAVNSAGISLWKGSVADPRVLRLEYPMSDTSGEMARVDVSQDTATITIRVPARADIGHIEFSALPLPTPKGNGADKASVRVSLGAIDWPATRQGKSK